jgi:hypothetical protein
MLRVASDCPLATSIVTQTRKLVRGSVSHRRTQRRQPEGERQPSLPRVRLSGFTRQPASTRIIGHRATETGSR